MLIKSNKIKLIKKQANQLHRQLINNLNKIAYKKLNRIYKRINKINQNYDASDQGLIFDRNDYNGANEYYEEFNLNHPDDVSSTNSNGDGAEDALQKDITIWIDLDPDVARKFIRTSDEVRHDIKTGQISDIPESDWYDNSDEGADCVVSDSIRALDSNYRWYANVNPYDDIGCARAYVPRAYQVVSDMKRSVDRAKRGQLRNIDFHALNLDIQTKSLYQEVSLIASGNLFRGKNLTDAKQIQKLLFNYHGKQLTKSPKAVHQALVYLDRFLTRHHKHLSSYRYNFSSIMKNRNVFRKLNTKMCRDFTHSNHQAKSQSLKNAHDLYNHVIPRPASAYDLVSFNYDGSLDYFTTPTAHVVVSILLLAVLD